jgi:hypothetical protein
MRQTDCPIPFEKLQRIKQAWIIRDRNPVAQVAWKMSEIEQLRPNQQ